METRGITRRLGRFWGSAWLAVAGRLTLQDASLQAWRERIFFTVFLCSLLLGLVPLSASVKMALENGMLMHLGFYLAIYLWAAAILLARRLPFKVRAWSGVCVYFVLGLVALFTLGPVGSGRPWFFATCVLASLLLGLRAGLLALLAIALSLYVLGFLLESGRLAWPLLDFYSPGTWHTTNLTLLLVCAIITVAQAVLVDGLGKALDRGRQAIANLAATNQKLQEEMAVRRKAEAELRQYQEKLEGKVEERTAELALTNRNLQDEVAARVEAERSLRLMASGVAHNFNNFLMAILSSTQAAQALLRDKPTDLDRLDSQLGNAVMACRGGGDMVKRLSRYVATGREASPSLEVVDVGPLLRALPDAVGGMPGAAGAGQVETRLSIGGGVFVRAAAGDLMEVFLNLAKNAREAMPTGGVLDISARVEQSQVVIAFKDTGIGADADTLKSFFAPYFSTKRNLGQGLGLTISQAIIISHGGVLSAESIPGRGATLTVRLPLAPAPPAARPQATSPAAARPVKILLVEDEGMVAMGVTFILESAGHGVHHVSTMSGALADLGCVRPDLVICDLSLPDAQGWEVCGRLERGARASGLGAMPIVVLSGWSEDQVGLDEQHQVKLFAYLQKPVESARLLGVVNRAATAT